jgi:DNA-binding winged helix-turn-helix (wHTH) protein/tetratricopeptide (TPR) repeat protein
MAPTGFRLGDFIVEPGTDRLLSVNGSARVELEPKTMAVLLALAERRGQVVSSDELIHLVWHDRPMGENPVYKAVAKLRRALRDEAGQPHYVETISRKGYRLLIEPQPLATEPHDLSSESPAPEVGTPAAARPAFEASRIAMAAAACALVVVTGGIVSGGMHPTPRATNSSGNATAVPQTSDAIALAALPLETRQLYTLARSEFDERRAGFATRLRGNAETLIAAAPSFAPGHALRAISCTFQAIYTGARAPSLSGTHPGDGSEALACAHQSVRRALQLDSQSAQALAAAGFVAWIEARQCVAPCDERGLVDAAQANLEQAARLDPTLPEARTWLGILYQERGDLARAAEESEASLALDPLNPVATYNANNFLIARGENARVRARLLALTQRPEAPPFVLAQLVENALAAGDRADALRWTQLLAAEEHSRSLQLLAAVSYARLGRQDDARTVLAAAGRTTDVDYDEDLAYAVWAHQLAEGPAGVRDYIDAQEHLRSERALPASAEEIRWWLEIDGLAHALANQPAPALAALEQVLGDSGVPRIRPGNTTLEADCANALAWAYVETGQTARAREVADGTLAALDRVSSVGMDKQPSFALNRALALALAGHRPVARAEVERLLARGLAHPVEFSSDPRWRTFMDTDRIALADAGRP